MFELLWLLAGLALGGVVAWLISAGRSRNLYSGRIEEADKRANVLEGRAAGLEGTITELRSQSLNAAADFEKLRLKMEIEQGARVKAETQLTETVQRLEEEKKLLEEAKTRLLDAFKAIAGDSLNTNNEAFLKLARENFEKLMSEARGDLGKRQEAIQGLVRPLSESLKQFEEHIHGIEKSRNEAYAGLTEQIRGLTSTQQLLQKETGNLVTALKAPKVVGSWGEITLRRVVELSGMSEHCNFDTEVSFNTEDGRLRPDMVVHLPEGREIVVDAKATFDAYQDAVSAETEELRKAALTRHAAQVRAHMQKLAIKSYSKLYEDRTPEFVVMFIPGESFFAAAVDIDRRLIEDALDKKVLLATPTTLVALLRTVALGWRQEQIARNAIEISDMGKQLYERMSKLAEYIQKIGAGLEGANKAYNSAVGSIEARVLPAARKFKDLGSATSSDIPPLSPLETSQRVLSIPEAIRE